jgi:SAM-dependent methyltransferase
LRDAYGISFSTQLEAESIWIRAYDRFKTHSQVLFRACPLCNNGDCVPALAQETGKSLVDATISTNGLDPNVLEHLPLVYRYCVHCDFFFVSPLPVPAFLDLDQLDARSREDLERDATSRRENRWMLDCAYIRDKLQSMAVHFEHAGFGDLVRTAPVLDIGCGTGVGIEVLRANGFTELWGAEPDLFSVRLIEREKSWLHVVWADAYSITREERLPKQFGLVMFDNVLEHQTRPIEALTAAWNLLAPGGLLWASVPNAWGREFRVDRMASGNLQFGHWSYFTPRAITRLLVPYVDDVRFYNPPVDFDARRDELAVLRTLSEDWVNFVARKSN